MVGSDASVDIEVRTFSYTGRPVPPGITGRLEFVDAPGDAEDRERYRARGHTIRGDRIAVAIDNSENLVKVHPPARRSRPGRLPGPRHAPPPRRRTAYSK